MNWCRVFTAGPVVCPRPRLGASTRASGHVKVQDETGHHEGNAFHSAEAVTMQQTYQARAPKTQPFGGAAFGPSDGTTLRWLGMAGFLINSRGTTIMVDPLLEGFDMPIMILSLIHI